MDKIDEDIRRIRYSENSSVDVTKKFENADVSLVELTHLCIDFYIKHQRMPDRIVMTKNQCISYESLFYPEDAKKPWLFKFRDIPIIIDADNEQ
jgi:hypothetical protein